MSTPLQDLGPTRVPQHVHSWLVAKKQMTGIPVVELDRQYITEAVEKELHTFSIAADRHKSKGLGEILGDVKRAWDSHGEAESRGEV